MLWPEKNSYKEFDYEKKIPAARKFPSPPHNFSNGPSLNEANVAKICRMQFHLFLRLFWLL